MKVKSESDVTESCPTLSNPMDCSPLGSSVHGILQARVLEWGAIAFSNMGQLTGSKLGKEYDKAVYCHSAYLTYMQSTSCEMLIKIAGRNISNLRYAYDTTLMGESEE